MFIFPQVLLVISLYVYEEPPSEEEKEKRKKERKENENDNEKEEEEEEEEGVRKQIHDVDSGISYLRRELRRLRSFAMVVFLCNLQYWPFALMLVPYSLMVTSGAGDAYVGQPSLSLSLSLTLSALSTWYLYLVSLPGISNLLFLSFD